MVAMNQLAVLSPARAMGGRALCARSSSATTDASVDSGVRLRRDTNGTRNAQ